MKGISFIKNSPELNGEKFLEMVEAVNWADKDTWPSSQVDQAISKSAAHYSAWSEGQVVGLVRVMSDELIFSCIPEIIVRPQFQSCGVGTQLMKMVIEDFGHTIIFFGAQAGNEAFFEKLGFKKGPQSYERCFRPAISKK